MRERKQPVRPGEDVHVQTNPTKAGPALNRDIQIKIGQQLRAAYDDIVDQGVPDRFVELLRDLDRDNSRGSGHDEDASE